MPLFRIEGDVACRIELDNAKIREEKVHLLIEKNLEELFGLKLVCHKPHIDGREIDTLALDGSMKVPVIIEYKRERDRHVMEQVAGYCAKLKNNKPAAMQFIKEDCAVDPANIDWDNPQVIIVAKVFTPDQVEEFTALREVPRLFTFQFFSGGIFSLEPVSVRQESRTRPASRTSLRDAHPRGGPWDLEHFRMRPEVRKIYDLLDKGITSLDTRVKPAKINKEFIGYGATTYCFCSVKPTAKALNVFVKCRKGLPQVTGLEVKKLHPDAWGPMTHTFKLTEEAQMEPALLVIKSALEDSI
jgi:predicted transport protein